MNEDLIQGFSPVSMPVTTPELIRELTSTIDEKSDNAVNIIPATAIEVVTPDENLQVGQSVKLNIQSTPTNANNPIVVWESSNPEVAIVTSDGIVYAEKIGEVDIIATSIDGIVTNSITLTVSATGSEEGGEEPEPEEPEEGDITTEDGENIITEDEIAKIVAENV